MTGPLDVLDEATRAGLPTVRAHGWRPLMLATLTEKRFSDENWLFERKLDSVRAPSTRDDDEPHLWSRNEKRIDTSYPELIQALAGHGGPGSWPTERSSRSTASRPASRLQARIHLTGDKRIKAIGVGVYYYLFDLLAFDGADLTGLPLRDRKRVLRAAFDFQDPLRFSAHRNTDGESYYREACERGWEGRIAKNADSRYRSVGYHEDGRLRCAGKVGTGYDTATLRALRARMDTMTQGASPFADAVREHTVLWIRPELVVQIGFTEWTTDGRLRHLRYTGTREGKPAAEVVRETT